MQMGFSTLPQTIIMNLHNMVNLARGPRRDTIHYHFGMLVYNEDEMASDRKWKKLI